MIESSGWECVWGREGGSDAGGLSVDEEIYDEHVVEGGEIKRSGAKVLSERRLARELASRSARRLARVPTSRLVRAFTSRLKRRLARALTSSLASVLMSRLASVLMSRFASRL